MFIIKSNVNNLKIVQEEFEDAKVVIRICKSKRDRQYNGKKRKRTQGQTAIYKTPHRKQKIELHESH